jgi:hypothetical protein
VKIPVPAWVASLRTGRGCYLVGQPVQLRGAGFTPAREFDLTDDGVDFGQAQTDAGGNFSVAFRPGGRARGVAQHVEHLQASDGVPSAATTFTLTLRPGAAFLSRGGNPHTLKARFEVWGYSLGGARRQVYLHYVAPSGRVRKTLSLGTTGGQCGFLRTAPRSLFAFSPSAGTWTLQIDTSATYSRAPSGPVTRIRARVG